MAGITDLTELLSRLDPELHPEPWVYALLPEGESLPESARPFAVVREDEGVGVVVTRSDAEALGLAGEFAAARITLRVHSALDAVGLTAAVARALAADGIGCNVIAGLHHDHLLVPWDRREAAMGALRSLAPRARP